MLRSLFYYTILKPRPDHILRMFHNSIRAKSLSSLRTISSCLSASQRTNSFICTYLTVKTQLRHFWGLEVAFNKVDEERVKLAGPDRTAAEWALKNEGAIKWTDSKTLLKNYNLLPSTNFASYKIEEIDLTATNVIGLGFEHLENLKHVKSINLNGCRTIRDDALEHLHFVKDTLTFLQISHCPMITEKGLIQLHCLKNLKTLVIFDLLEIKDFEKAISNLRQEMPWCHVQVDDPQEKESQNDEGT